MQRNTTKKMCISQHLKEHPVLQESIDYKMNYIAVLQYFCAKYNADDQFACAMMELYRGVFNIEQAASDPFHSQKIKSVMSCVCATKLKKFRLYSHRFALVIDCLFLCCFGDEAKGQEIFHELKSFFHARHHKKMDALFAALYQGSLCTGMEPVDYMLSCWNKNSAYLAAQPQNILITANMSAGKSTLINALIGKKVSRTKNSACTAKLHYIQSKAFEDYFNYEYDHLLCLNADPSMLMEDHRGNKSETIIVGTYFRMIGERSQKICFIDTPGVNSSSHDTHRLITEKAVRNGAYDKLVYVINAENMGTNDDSRHLKYVADAAQGKQVIFVLNKVDHFRTDEDDVADSIAEIRDEVKSLGFADPVIYPVSAYAGFLAKKRIWGESLTEYETEDVEVLRRRFKRAEYDLSQYYTRADQEYGRSVVDLEQDKERKKYLLLLKNSGVLELENAIFQ